MGNLIAEVPYKRNGKTVKFYDDHMDYKGNNILYADIDILTTSALSTRMLFLGIPAGRSFAGAFQFKMNTGKKFTINLSSLSVFGIPFHGSPKKNEKLYPPLFDAVNSLVAKSMAQKYIDKINQGETVEVAGLSINSSEAKTTGKMKKTVVISKENYRNCRHTPAYGTEIFDKSGQMICRTSTWSLKNNLLIPYIFDTIFV